MASSANDDLGRLLLAHARRAIASALGESASPSQSAPELAVPGATFVTLTQNGHLRGCIGSLEAWRPLGQDVTANAQAAALRDPRFPPLTPAELAGTRVEVSLLGPAIPLPCPDEATARAALRPGIDGVILECQGRRATFLPQVWDELPDPADFLGHLKRKAGLPADFWSSDVRLARYEVQKWKEPLPPS